MEMALGSQLVISFAIILILIVIQCSGEEKKWNIVKGTNELSRAKLAYIEDSVEVCKNKNTIFKFIAKFTALTIGSNNLGVRIEVHTQKNTNNWLNQIGNVLTFRDPKFVGVYEVENVILSNLENKKKLHQDVENVCEYINVDKRDFYGMPLYLIKFLNAGKWWCDTYYGNDLRYIAMDECNEIIKDYDAGKKYIVKYSSVPDKTKCDKMKLTKNNALFEIEALSCRQHSTDSNNLWLVVYYKGYAIEYFTLTLRENKPIKLSDVDSNLVLRLIRIRGEEKQKDYKRISVQYLNDGYWNCRVYTDHAWTSDKGYRIDFGEAIKSAFTFSWYWCEKFCTYERPFAVKEVIPPSDMNETN
ncbi:uncharacterized protein LOC129005406 isoform X1 [Macrosteles quadrilineatus]|uniref:uncharacterized protein LOC129005406 isoform X1 n=1 Tax=Macrosteles quadrilineatus TaxID=74068 RepID=UPI0023E149A6|nr:uncharacterized protein LOC129005406 isoform X1 [Macrosteles quadrilineatus]